MNIRIFLLFTIVIYSILAFGGHAHSHSNEPPHLKYTKEINEAAQKEDDEHSHSHSHGHSHGHGHSHHQGCGHSHGHEDEFDEEEEEHAHSHSHGHSHGHKPQRMATTLPKIPTATYTEQPYSEDGWLSFLNNPQIRLWTYAIGSTLIISAFPCLLLAFIPVNSNANGESPLLRTLLAFGAGGLLGDAFLHLIPHASPGGHSHSHSHSHQSGHGHEPHDLKVGTWVLVGFMVFFIVEKVVRIIRGEDHQHAGHGHSHSNVKKTTKEKTKEKDSDGEKEEEKTKEGKKQITHEDGGRVRVAAYLNLIADFMHNFTDGLAIGASFIAGTTIGIVTMVTVLVHEVPHEIGDFAILVQSGFSKKRAMLIQLCTALGALAGCTLSLWDVDAAALAEAAEQSWAIPFTAGGFIYIGTVSMIPDLLEGSTAWQSVKEILAILLGLFMMYLIAFFE